MVVVSDKRRVVVLHLYTSGKITSIGSETVHQAEISCLLIAKMLQVVQVPIRHLLGFELFSVCAVLELPFGVNVKRLGTHFDVDKPPDNGRHHVFMNAEDRCTKAVRKLYATSCQDILPPSLLPSITYDSEMGSGVNMHFQTPKRCYATVYTSGKVLFTSAISEIHLREVSTCVTELCREFSMPKKQQQRASSLHPTYPVLSEKQNWLQQFKQLETPRNWYSRLFRVRGNKTSALQVSSEFEKIYINLPHFLLWLEKENPPDQQTSVQSFRSEAAKTWVTRVIDGLRQFSITLMDCARSEFEIIVKSQMYRYHFRSNNQITSKWVEDLFGHDAHNAKKMGDAIRTMQEMYDIHSHMEISLPVFLFFSSRVNSDFESSLRSDSCEHITFICEIMRKAKHLFTWDNFYRLHAQYSFPAVQSLSLPQIFAVPNHSRRQTF